MRLHPDAEQSRWHSATVERASTKITALTLVAVIALAAFLSTESTVLHPREQDGDVLRKYVLPILPESWPFFTKPPTDPEFNMYTVSGRDVETATDFPNSSASNMFGFARTQRAQGPELARLALDIPSTSWVDCISISGDCVVAANEERALRLSNSSTFPAFCGEIAFIYFDAATAKFAVSTWADGTQMYYVTRQEMFGASGAVGELAHAWTSVPLATLAASWGAIAIELAIAVLVFIPTRPAARAAVLLSALLHIGIIIVIGLGSFGLIMVGAVICAVGSCLDGFKDLLGWRFWMGLANRWVVRRGTVDPKPDQCGEREAIDVR